MSYYNIPACVFHQCLNEPTAIVVWGCYEHIDEFVICSRHLTEWSIYHEQRNVRCTYCYEPAEDYIVKGIQYLRAPLRTHHP
jgi:hypothetical protein